MAHLRRFISGVLILSFAIAAHAAEPQDYINLNDQLSSKTVHGENLRGTVTNSFGSPLGSTLVSVSSVNGTKVTVCDVDGKFEFKYLVPGEYLLRAHLAGFTATQRHVVKIDSDHSTIHPIQLKKISVLERTKQDILTAGFTTIATTNVTEGLLQPAVISLPENAYNEDGNKSSTHDHDEKTWRLRRARRSVLKEHENELELARAGTTLPGNESEEKIRSRTSSSSSTGDLFNVLPLSGQFHLLTRANTDSQAKFLSTDALPAQIAYVRIGVPGNKSGWNITGSTNTGYNGSWVLTGSYVGQTSPEHSIRLDMSYSKQYHPSDDPFEISSSNNLTASKKNREVGRIKANGTWEPLQQLTLEYGASISRYGYLEDNRLFSPHAQVTLQPISRTSLSLTVSMNNLAPGSEEFLPPSSGAWLPPERTFAPLATHETLKVERSRHMELSIEQKVGNSSTIEIRRFRQDIKDQMITMFGIESYGPSPIKDHYYLTNASGVNVDGWGINLSHKLAGRINGEIDYSVSQAQWKPWTVSGLEPRTIGALRTGTEKLHDVTTSIETNIHETETQVFVLYRVNNAFLKTDADSLTSGLDGRFAFRVKQALPFSPFGKSTWSLLVDIRSLFREQIAGSSLYDELLVVSPPKQFTGGLIVNF